MITVKDLIENSELMNNIIEDLEDIPEDTEVFYSVWALGYNKFNDLTGDEVLIGEFIDPDKATEYAETVTYETIKELGFRKSNSETVYFSIEVETVISDPEDEDGGTMNIGTVYKRDLWLTGKYGSDENTTN